MKFVALALLLAVGSHAASLQADEPMSLEQIRSIVDDGLEGAKNQLKAVLANLDSTDYAQYKAHIIQAMDGLHNQLKEVQKHVSPLTDSVYPSVAEAAQAFRDSLISDYNSLRANYESQGTELKQAVDRHFAEYSSMLSPIIKDYQDKHLAEVQALRAQLEPVLEQLSVKAAENVEETKKTLVPIVDGVYAKLLEHLATIKNTASPYVNEYKDKADQMLVQIRSISHDNLNTMSEKLRPLVEDVYTKLGAMAQIIAGAMN